MGVAGTAEQSAASLVQNQELDIKTLQTREHRCRKNCICQLAVDQGTRILAFESFLDPRTYQRGLWIELPQWLSVHRSQQELVRSPTSPIAIKVSFLLPLLITISFLGVGGEG